MRVWQPGGHLMRERGAHVEDWSWQRTRRRLGALVRLGQPRDPLDLRVVEVGRAEGDVLPHAGGEQEWIL